MKWWMALALVVLIATIALVVQVWEHRDPGSLPRPRVAEVTLALRPGIKAVLEIYRNGKLVYSSPDPPTPALFREILCHFLVPRIPIDACEIKFWWTAPATINLPVTGGGSYTPAALLIGFNGTTCSLRGYTDGYLVFYTSPASGNNLIGTPKYKYTVNSTVAVLEATYIYNATFNGSLSSISLISGSETGYDADGISFVATAELFCDNLTIPVSFRVGDVITIRYVIYFEIAPPFFMDFWNATVHYVFGDTGVESNLQSGTYSALNGHSNLLSIVPCSTSDPWAPTPPSSLSTSCYSYAVNPLYWKYSIMDNTLYVHFFGVFNEVLYPVRSITIRFNYGSPYPLAYIPLGGTYYLGNGTYVGVSLGIRVSEG